MASRVRRWLDRAPGTTSGQALPVERNSEETDEYLGYPWLRHQSVGSQENRERVELITHSHEDMSVSAHLIEQYGHSPGVVNLKHHRHLPFGSIVCPYALGRPCGRLRTRL